MMNKVILMGRLTRDPEIRESNGTVIGRYSLAVDRRYSKDARQTADFIPCVVFGKGAEFAEKWLKQGMRIVIAGRIQTGSYTNKDGRKVYTTDVVVEEQEFAESKAAGAEATAAPAEATAAPAPQADDDFVPIPDDLDEIPFV